MNKVDLELLRSMFADNRLHIAVAAIAEVEVLVDFSAARVRVTLPQQDDLEIVARIAWGMCSTGGGAFQLPVVGDWCLVAFTSADQAWVIAQLSSRTDRIPVRAASGAATVIASQDGQELDISSDTKVNLGRGNPLLTPDEPVVLGNTLKEYLEGLSDRISAIYDLLIAGAFLFTTSPGNPTAPNPASATLMGTAKTAHELAKAQFLTVDLTNILSQITFTER